MGFDQKRYQAALSKLAYFERLGKELARKLETNAAVFFTFHTISGTEHTVLGTRKVAVIPAEHRPNGSGSDYTNEQIRFYDLQEQRWKSCLVYNVVQIHY